MPKYRIIRHPSVADDLADIALLLADYSGVEIALRKLDEIETVIRDLTDLPHVGSLRHEIAKGLRAIPAAGKAVICFVVDDSKTEVRILAIGYAGSNWIAVTKDRN